MSTAFPPFTKQIAWADVTTDESGNPLPSDETLEFTALGIRPDGNTSFGPGNYQFVVDVPAPAAEITRADFDAAFAKAYPAVGKLAPGNYWLGGQQEDVEQGTEVASKWTATETPFSIPVVPVTPAAPGPFTVS